MNLVHHECVSNGVRRLASDSKLRTPHVITRRELLPIGIWACEGISLPWRLAVKIQANKRPDAFRKKWWARRPWMRAEAPKHFETKVERPHPIDPFCLDDGMACRGRATKHAVAAFFVGMAQTKPCAGVAPERTLLTCKTTFAPKCPIAASFNCWRYGNCPKLAGKSAAKSSSCPQLRQAQTVSDATRQAAAVWQAAVPARSPPPKWE